MTESSLNIRINLEQSEIIEILDNTEFSETFNKEISTPYLESLYEDLITRGSSSITGISKMTFLDVIF